MEIAGTGSLPSPKLGQWFGVERLFPIRSGVHPTRTLSETPPTFSLRKEVIQPQVLLRLPCYDFIPVTAHSVGRCFLAVSARTSATNDFHDVTGGVYKARERIHRGMLIHDY